MKKKAAKKKVARKAKAPRPEAEPQAGGQAWRKIVASSVDWQQAHATLDEAVQKLPAELRGKRPDGLPHSVWELVEHIRLAQEDLIEFSENPKYVAPKWPDDYWPPSPEPPSEAAWKESLAAIKRDAGRLKTLTQRASLDLTKAVPWGEGQTYLRNILIVVDHTRITLGRSCWCADCSAPGASGGRCAGLTRGNELTAHEIDTQLEPSRP